MSCSSLSPLKVSGCISILAHYARVGPKGAVGIRVQSGFFAGMATRHDEWRQETITGKTVEEFVPWLLDEAHRQLNPIDGTETEKRHFQRLMSLEELSYDDIVYSVARDKANGYDVIVAKARVVPDRLRSP